MAGLVAAARLRELGRTVVVREKGTRAGGSMLLSSCVVWRHRDLQAFRDECPQGDEALQRLVWERLDDALAWLVARGAPVVWDETGNPRTVGKRFDPRGLVEALARRRRARRRRARRRAVDPLHRRVRCVAGARHAVRRGRRRRCACGRIRGRRATVSRWARPRRSAHRRHGRVLRAQHARRAVGRDASSSRCRSSTDGSRGSSTRTASSSSPATACRGRRRTWSPRRPGGRERGRSTSSTRRRSRERVRDRTVADMVAAAPAESRVALADLPFEPPEGAVGCGARDRVDHAHDRRPARRRAGARAARGRDAGGRALGGGRRRGRDRDRRLRERPRAGARARPGRRPEDAASY